MFGPDAALLEGRGPSLQGVPFASKLGIHGPPHLGRGLDGHDNGDRRMGSFLYFIVDTLIQLLIFAMVINAVLSWLIVFEVVNMRNRFIYQVSRMLDAVTRPVMRPVQRIIPPFGGVDISPVIVIIVLVGVQRFLLPMIFAPLQHLIG